MSIPKLHVIRLTEKELQILEIALRGARLSNEQDGTVTGKLFSKIIGDIELKINKQTRSKK